MTTFSPVNNLRAIPLPLYAPGGAASVGAIPMKPNWQFKGAPLPEYDPYTAIFAAPPAGYPMFPIKPLPGTAGGGGAVGTPIDSG